MPFSLDHFHIIPRPLLELISSTLCRFNSVPKFSYYYFRMKRVFCSMKILAVRSKRAFSLWILSEMQGSQTAMLLLTFIKRIVMALLTCIFALGGATVGTITGAIKGQTTETGLVRGAGVGAVAGAITAVQLLELMVNGEPFSMAALIWSLVNGKVFMEWVSPALLKAYQWQINATEAGFREISDIFEANATKGLSHDKINSLPKDLFYSCEATRAYHDPTCAICLQDFINEDYTRKLPSCKHAFHLQCIDQWLVRHGSCPICRIDV